MEKQGSKQIYLLRHGETEYNRMGIIQGSGVDAPLNELGQAQAEAFYRRYCDLKFDIIITSELQRSIQTVAAFEQHIPKVNRDARINEIHWGVSEGQVSDPASIQEYRSMIEGWGRGELHLALEGGESAASLIARCDEFIHSIEKMTESSILVCSHGRTIRCLISRFLRQPAAYMEKVEHSNTGLYILEFDENWTVLEANNIDHLVG